MYKCLISALKLLIESNVATKETRHSGEEGERVFTVTIFADDDSSGMFNDDVSFGEVLKEASLLYREFGYGVPNVVLWAMASTVCHENHIYNANNANNDNNNDDSNNDNNNDAEAVVYKSVSYGGALTIWVGCDASEICTYLGVENKKKEWKHHNMWRADQHNEWQNEWSHLVEMLYNRRYYQFEQYYWKNKNI
jgi:hypothetical protein